jgi:type III secretory pathway component EscT
MNLNQPRERAASVRANEKLSAPAIIAHFVTKPGVIFVGRYCMLVNVFAFYCSKVLLWVSKHNYIQFS